MRGVFVLAACTLLLSFSARAGESEHGGAVSPAADTAPAAPRMQAFDLNASCRILKANFKDPALMERFLALDPDWNPFRMVAQPDGRGGHRLAVLMGEGHMLPCTEYAKVEEIVERFNEFAIEDYQGKAHRAGQPWRMPYKEWSRYFDRAMLEPLQHYLANRKNPNAGCRLSGTQAAISRVHKNSSNARLRLYKLEGEDFDHPLNPKEKVAQFSDAFGNDDADRLKDFFRHGLADMSRDLTQLFLNATTDEGLKKMWEMYWVQTRRKPGEGKRVVERREAELAEQLQKHGKLMPFSFNTDVRNKVMAQNIGLTFARRPASKEPLLVLTGFGHTAGIKYQLMLHQKFREIPASALKSCLESWSKR